MENVLRTALKKVVDALDAEAINYMVVGGFAVSYHNRVRTTNDIDLVVQIYPRDVASLLTHFPEWQIMEETFTENVRLGTLFNLTDFETGIRYDFISFQDSEYSYVAFTRRQKVTFFGIECYLCAIEDLVLSKLQWYGLSQSDRQLEDIKFLLLDDSIDMTYVGIWANRLNIDTYGLLG